MKINSKAFAILILSASPPFHTIWSLTCLHTFFTFDPYIPFLNQARTGCRPARTWFLKIDPVRIVCMCMCVCVCVCVCVCLRVCVCPPPRLLITSGVMWCDIDSKRLVKQVL